MIFNDLPSWMKMVITAGIFICIVLEIVYRVLKNRIKKLKQRQKADCPTITLRISEIELIRDMHISFARGYDSYIIERRVISPLENYLEAKLLCDNFGMTKEEVLVATGFYVQEEVKTK